MYKISTNDMSWTFCKDSLIGGIRHYFSWVISLLVQGTRILSNNFIWNISPLSYFNGCITVLLLVCPKNVSFSLEVQILKFFYLLCIKLQKFIKDKIWFHLTLFHKNLRFFFESYFSVETDLIEFCFYKGWF